MVSVQRLRTLAVAGTIIALDQWTKWIVRHAFVYEGNGRVIIPGFFDLRYVRNTGAAWGVFSGFQACLVLFALVMLGVLIWKRHALVGGIPLGWLVFGMLVGGIVGNLIDRIAWKYVVDFIDCHWHASHFPAFNVADASICCSVGLYLLLQGLAEHRARCGQKTSRT